VPHHRAARTRPVKNFKRTSVTALDSEFDGNYITVRLGSNSVHALIDTGAACSLMSDELARELQLQVIPPTHFSKPLLSANGSEMALTGHVKAELYLRGLKVEHHMEVAKSLSSPFILGRDFLTANQDCVNYALKPPMFTLFDGRTELPFYTCCDENNCYYGTYCVHSCVS